MEARVSVRGCDGFPSALIGKRALSTSTLVLSSSSDGLASSFY